MILLAVIILLLALFGGVHAYANTIITAGLGAAGWVTMIAACFAMRANLAIRPYLWPVSFAVVASFLANLDIFPAAAGRVYLYATALAALLVAARWVTAKQLLYSLILSAGVWLAGDLWLRAYDNQNIKAVWPVVFMLALMGAYSEGWLNKWETSIFCLPFFIYLLVLGSRGAVLGFAGGVLMYYAPTNLPRRNTVYVYLIPVLLGLLFILRPETALNRLHYWQEAWSAFLANPIFGVGPGGLRARELITEPGGGFQLHAHNFIVTTTAELGLVGLAALALTGFTLYVQRSTFNIHPWQAAIVTALVCHSLVDEPLFWPGPMLLAALVAGTMTRKEL